MGVKVLSTACKNRMLPLDVLERPPLLHSQCDVAWSPVGSLQGPSAPGLYIGPSTPSLYIAVGRLTVFHL